MNHWVYILLCTNNSLYTGSTSDPQRRYKQHCNGTGAKYTRAFPPSMMVACWIIEGGIGNALRVEASIKKLNRPQKEDLVANQSAVVKFLPTELSENIHIKPYKLVTSS